MQNKENKKQPLFIWDEWITGESCLFTVKNPFEHARAKQILGKMRTKFVEELKKEGFEIITDNKNIPEDAIYFIMDENAVCDEKQDACTWKKEFDKKIFKAGGPKLNYPMSLSMEEFFEKPFFPAVLKNETTNGGKDKILIETPEQLEKIKEFYYEHINNLMYKTIFSLTIFQQYINTPTNYQTYMRVLMGASGDVLGACLKYSLLNYDNQRELGVLEKHFCDTDSKYFLNSKSMFGYYSGGGNIYFSQLRFSSEKSEILKAHNIDCQRPQMPDEVLEVSKNIAQDCNSILGIICGIDYIYNAEDGKWYYLENQAFPAIDEWANDKNIKLPKQKNVDTYLKYLEIELDARKEALTLVMNKKTKN